MDNYYSGIDSVFSYYTEEVIPAVAYAISEIDKFPEQLLNEIRSCMTHLSRANSYKKEGESNKVKEEIESAHKHLQRAALDALKIALLSHAEKCDQLIDTLSRYMVLPNEIYSRAKDLKQKRREVMVLEGNNYSGEVVCRIKELVRDYSEFCDYLNGQYQGYSQKVANNKLWLKRFEGFIIGILTSAIVAVIFHYWDQILDIIVKLFE